MKNLVLAFLFSIPALLCAQLPSTDIYLFDMAKNSQGQLIFLNPKLLNGDNIGGYNNQPNFIGNNIYLTTRTLSDTLQTDIYALDIDNYLKSKVTATKQSEYSPNPMPDGKHFSVIRVQENGDQLLWKYPIDRSNEGSAIFSNIKNVGYHFWLNDYTVALFLVGENGQPHKLVLGDTKTNTSKFIITSIGRGFQKLPNGNLAFIYKRFDNRWSIRELNRVNFRTRDLVLAKANSEDFVILKDGTILMGQENKLFKYNLNFDTYWVEVADFAKYGIYDITRLAVKGGKLALISVN